MRDAVGILALQGGEDVNRNLGFKLEHVMYSPSGQGVASAVAIGISFKRWKA